MNADRAKIATKILCVPGLMALGLSALTSFTFMGTHLHIHAAWERGALCAVGEVALISLSVHSWATGKRFSELAALSLVLVQSIGAFEVSPGLGGAVRTALGPGLAALLVHLVLGLDLKRKEARSNTLVRRILREAQARFEARFGLGRLGEDAKEISRSRAADRAVRLAVKLDRLPEGSLRRSRVTLKLGRAIDGAQHGLTGIEAAHREGSVVGRVVRLKSVGDLAGLNGDHAWVSPEPSTAQGLIDLSLSPEPSMAQGLNSLSPEPSEVEPVSHDVEPIRVSEPVSRGLNPQVSNMVRLEPRLSEPVEPSMAQVSSEGSVKARLKAQYEAPVKVAQGSGAQQVEPSVPAQGSTAQQVEPSVAQGSGAQVSQINKKAQDVARVVDQLRRGVKVTGSSVASDLGVSLATGKRYAKEARDLHNQDPQTGAYL